MRYQMKELEKIGKTFALGVHIVVKVIYGDVVKSLLEEADENVGPLPRSFSSFSSESLSEGYRSREYNG